MMSVERACLLVAEMPYIVEIMPRRETAPPKQTRGHNVAILAYDGLCTFEFGIAVEMFGLPRPELQEWYDCTVCSLENRPVEAVGGITVQAPGNAKALLRADTIVIPGWKKPLQAPPGELLTILRTAHHKGARLVSFCVGSHVLASAGLLDGRKATTHWRFVEDMRERFPKVQVLPDVLYVDEGNLLTSAGSAAGIDLCLHLIRRDFGTLVANKVAKRAVVAAHREGGQAQFIDRPVGEEADPWMSALVHWAQKHLSSRLTIDQMAKQAHTSKRTLARRFVLATGMSPMDWLNTLRVRHARDLLETTKLSIEEVAEQCGFGSAAILRHHFRRKVQLSPQVYRERFGQPPRRHLAGVDDGAIKSVSGVAPLAETTK